MTKVLAIRSSISGESSISNRLVDQTVAQLHGKDPQLQLFVRDLGDAPIPHLDADAFGGIRGEPGNEAQMAARALSDALVAELQGADVIVIGAPMYNFGIPSTLKTWFDYVLRPGITFQYSQSGPKGLLEDKRAIVIVSRGGLYSEGPAKAFDSQEPHLRTLLGFIGVTDVSFVRAERLAMGEQHHRAAISLARKQITEALATFQAAA